MEKKFAKVLFSYSKEKMKFMKFITKSLEIFSVLTLLGEIKQF